MADYKDVKRDDLIQAMIMQARGYTYVTTHKSWTPDGYTETERRVQIAPNKNMQEFLDENGIEWREQKNDN